MLDSIRKFSKTFFAKILLVIVIIPFVFWGMGGVFNSGNTNSLAKINSINISTQDFIDHINQSNINQDIIREKLNDNILEEIESKRKQSGMIRLFEKHGRDEVKALE